MQTTYLIGNWKANKTSTEALSWRDQVLKRWPKTSPGLEIAVCLPFIHLSLLADHPVIKPGAQNLSPYPDGAYTGEISARMIAGKISYVILGHSERREYFHETSQTIALKVTQALEYGIIPIIGVSHQTFTDQINRLKPEELAKVIIMYEPPEAISRLVGPIGVGDAAPVDEVVAAIQAIKAKLTATPVLYGGSVKSHNLKTYLDSDTIDGVVVGSASLDATEWLKLINIAQKYRG